ncbi:MAG: hypothetical protein JKY53_04085 [Flavobacteriales bacterium]|nr:hypothetical protein [Flavobacteriales bacterium]
MDNTSLKLYYDRPCKFKLRSGKDIYGVVWKEGDEFKETYYFSSSENYNRIKTKGAVNSSLKTPVNINDIVAAEMLQGIVPGKDMFK